MPIRADYHLHSSHSGDSHTPMEEMIAEGIRLGLKEMCFTEHMDLDFPDTEAGPGSTFLLNTDSYLYDFIRYREAYADRIRLHFGVELGLQQQLSGKNAQYVNGYDFDFVIGSVHVVGGQDPYFASFYEGRSEKAAYREYFETVLANVRRFTNFDVCGHLDYVVRYGPNKNREYSYEPYRDVIDAILETLVENEKGLELNTGGYRSGLGAPNPCADILKRYREIGGEIVTVGSDAHSPEHIASHFDDACELLKECGFRYYCVFEKRVAEFVRL